MTKSNCTILLSVSQAPEEVFKAVTNVRGWWSDNIEGDTVLINDEFTFRMDGVHTSTQKLIEVVPFQKIVWLVTYSELNFVEDTTEWTGTKISFEIERKGDQTELRFIHIGLQPEIECYEACSNAWGQYIQGSLFKLINEGKGTPEVK